MKKTMCWCTGVSYLIADQIAASSSSVKGKLSVKAKVFFKKIYDFARVVQQCHEQWGCEKQGNTIKCWVTLTERGNPANAQGFISNFFGTGLEPT